MNPLLVLGSIAIFFVACFLIAHEGKKRTSKTIEDYFIAGRRIGSFVAAMTYSATTYSAFMMVGLVGLTAIHGVGALGFELVYLMGLMLAVLFGLRFYVASKRWNLVTPAQLLAERYGSPTLGLIVALLYHVFLIPYMAAQLIGMGKLLSGLTGGAIPFGVGAVLTMAITFVYTLWGGMRAVAWTDAFQAIIMLLTSLIALFTAFQLAGGISTVFQRLSQEPALLSVPGPNNKFTILSFISMTVPWFFFCLSNPQVVQRFYVPKSVRSLKNMIKGHLIFGFTYTVIVTLLGLVARILVVEPYLAGKALGQDDVTPKLLTMIWEPIAIIVSIGILAASITTLDSILLTLSSELAVNMVKALKPSFSKEKALLISQVLMIVIAVATIVFSLTGGVIVELAVTSSSWLLQLVPAFIAALVWRRANKLSACSSIATGVAVTGVLTVVKKLQPSTSANVFLQVDPGIWGFTAASITLIALSLLTKTKDEEAKFVEELNEALKSFLKQP